MSMETYKLKLENLQLKLKQNPTTPAVFEYLEARILLLEELVHQLLESK